MLIPELQRLRCIKYNRIVELREGSFVDLEDEINLLLLGNLLDSLHILLLVQQLRSQIAFALLYIGILGVVLILVLG